MVGVNGPKYTPPSGSLYSKGMQFQGAGGNIVNKYQTLGTTGMSKAEFQNQGRSDYLRRKEEFDINQSNDYANQLKQWGFDPKLADTDGNGIITKKEFNRMEKMIQQYTIQNRYQNGGQTTQGGNAFGLLNSIGGDVMGAITGGGDSSGSSGGGFIEQAAGFVKNIFNFG